MFVLTNVFLFFYNQKDKYEFIEVYSIQVHSKAARVKAELNKKKQDMCILCLTLTGRLQAALISPLPAHCKNEPALVIPDKVPILPSQGHLKSPEGLVQRCPQLQNTAACQEQGMKMFLFVGHL